MASGKPGAVHQGDGACFEGYYFYRKRSVHEIRAYAPTDHGLAAIADDLQRIQKKNFYALEAHIRHRGRYYHEHSMEIDVERVGHVSQSLTSDAEAGVAEALRALARWLYSQRDREYDYQMSKEVVDEALEANGYAFTGSGAVFR